MYVAPADPLKPTDRNDIELTALAQRLLNWNRSLPHGAVAASVRQGCLTLTGEVLWHYQRQDASHCVQGLPGIHGIENCITLKARPCEP